jgi:hypothetical protein
MAGSYFILACILGFGSWLIAFVEMIATHSFNRLAFNIGIPVIKRTIEMPTNEFAPKINTTIKESEGKFCFTDDGKVLFMSQYFWFKFFRTNTPFPFKVVGTINKNNTIDLIARLPIGASLFFMFWVIGWTIGMIGAFQSGDRGFGMFGLISAAVIIGISYPIEKKRMEIMIEELKKIITGQHAE